MKALMEFDHEIKSLQALCDIVLADPADLARHRQLEAMLGSDQTPLQLPVGHGLVIDLVVGMAAERASAVRGAWGWPVVFGAAVLQLRQALFTVDREIGRRREMR